MRLGLVALLLLSATPVKADIMPVADRADPRVLTADYISGAAIRAQVAVGATLTVLLPRGDRVLSAELTSPSDWQIEVDQDAADSFKLTPLRPAGDTRASIQTGLRTYLFTLSSAPPDDTPLYLRVLASAPSSAAPAQREAPAPQIAWKLSGNRELLPSSIRDDGSKTYLEWSPDQAIPAVLAIDRLKREEMINGYMRGSVFTIDRVYDHLVFRLDKVFAEARRKVVKSR